jgi:hypothetical protein
MPGFYAALGCRDKKVFLEINGTDIGSARSTVRNVEGNAAADLLLDQSPAAKLRLGVYRGGEVKPSPVFTEDLLGDLDAEDFMPFFFDDRGIDPVDIPWSEPIQVRRTLALQRLKSHRDLAEKRAVHESKEEISHCLCRLMPR